MFWPGFAPCLCACGEDPFVPHFWPRQLGPRDLDDKVHDVFVIVAQAIRRGDLRDPERLMDYVRTVVTPGGGAYRRSRPRTR
jgi:hypothetical protein